MSYIGSLLSVGRNWTDPSTETGFDYEQALKIILHPVPDDYDPLAEGGAD